MNHNITSDNKYSIAIIDDDPIFRRYLIEILEGMTEVKEIAEFPNAELFLVDKRTNKMDLVLIDIGLPHLQGDELVSIIYEWNTYPKICILSTVTQDEKIFNCLKAGAVGFLWKKEAEDIPFIIRTLLKGGGFITPTIALLLARFFQSHRDPSSASNLTPKEKQILDLLTKGMQARAVAKFLDISENTIRTHISNLYKKLHVKNISELHAKYKKIKHPFV